MGRLEGLTLVSSDRDFEETGARSSCDFGCGDLGEPSEFERRVRMKGYLVQVFDSLKNGNGIYSIKW